MVGILPGVGTVTPLVPHAPQDWPNFGATGGMGEAGTGVLSTITGTAVAEAFFTSIDKLWLRDPEHELPTAVERDALG